MSKVKAKISFEYEYDFKPENYPEDWTVEQMLEMDKVNIKEDPNIFLNGDCEVELTLMINKNCSACGSEYVGEYLDSSLCEDCKW